MNNHTKVCKKLGKNKTETELHAALNCMQLMKDGCSIKNGNYISQLFPTPASTPAISTIPAICTALLDTAP